jgi:hypothetical protein
MNWFKKQIDKFADWLNKDSADESYIGEDFWNACNPPKSSTVNRVEVITDEEIVFVKYLSGGHFCTIDYQDGGNTLKIFLRPKVDA